MVRTGKSVVFAVLLCTAGGAVADDLADADVERHRAVYEQLKSLAGLWAGKVADETGTPVQVRYEVMSNGRAVFEHLFPGTEHEMVTAYYLASGQLQATHYCAIGNQPAYRLSADSTPTAIRMEFAGGTGFDPQADQHAHGVDIGVGDASHIEVAWHFRKGTLPTGTKRMQLERTSSPGA